MINAPQNLHNTYICKWRRATENLPGGSLKYQFVYFEAVCLSGRAGHGNPSRR